MTFELKLLPRQITTLLVIAVVTLSHGSVLADDPPGVLISQSPDPRLQYLIGTSLTVLPSGEYVAAHGWWWPRDKRYESLVFSSSDKGKTWKQQSGIKDLFWATVFFHDSNLYLMGTERHWGNLQIRRSKDQGMTWTEPTDDRNGLLTQGMQLRATPVAMPMFHGRIWRPVEKAERNRHQALVLSAPLDSDLLDASSWTESNGVFIERDAYGGPNNRLFDGCLVPGPDRSLINVMRIDAPGERIAILPVSPDGKRVSFEPQSDILDFFGSHTQFTIRYDENTKRYWSLVNKRLDPFAFSNVLVLVSSKNLRDWRVETTLLQHIDSKNHGFQQLSWHFEGNDIIAVSATQWEIGHPTCLTFHRFEDFRKLTPADSAPLLGDLVPKKHICQDFVVQGNNLEIKPFRKGEHVFNNWTSFRFQDLPAQFAGWSFTQTMAASTSDLVVTANRDCDLFFATGIHQGIIDVTGWTEVKNSQFRYSDKDVGIMNVFKRSVRAGQVVKIPDGSWTGGIVLIPPK